MQLQQIGVRHEIFGMTASYAIESQTERSKLFYLEFPLPSNLLQTAPHALLLNQKNTPPFISANVYFQLKLHKPHQDFYILSRQDKDLLELLMGTLKSGQSFLTARQNPIPNPIPNPNTSLPPLPLPVVRDDILDRAQNLLRSAQERSKRRRLIRQARNRKSSQSAKTSSSIPKEDNFEQLLQE